MSAVERVTTLIELLIDDSGEIGIRELAQRSGIPKSSVQRTLDSLQHCGWLVQNSSTGNYRLSVRLLSLSNGWRMRQELVSQTQDKMNEICKISQQTVLLLVLDGQRGICLNKVEPERTIKLIANVGEKFALHAAACGKILLAYAPSNVQDEILSLPLSAYTENTIVKPEDLRNEIQKIRQQGCAFSLEEMTPGAAEVAVPILDVRNNIIAGLSIAGPSTEMQKKLDEFVPLLKNAAAFVCSK